MMQMKCLESSFKMIKFTKENHSKLLNGDRSRFCQLNVITFNSILYHENLIRDKIFQTQEIYSSYYSSNADKFPEEIKKKLDKHFRFVNRCKKYSNEIWHEIRGFLDIERRVVKNPFKPSSIKKVKRKIQRDIKIFFDKWNHRLKKRILIFYQDHLEDENGHFGKALQLLC